MRLIAIDPGLHALGVAWFDDGVLERAAYRRIDAFERPTEFRTWALHERTTGCDVLVLERPVVYPPNGRFRKRVDPKWLMLLAEVIGALALVVCPPRVIRYRPAEWKGRVSKDETWAQVQTALTASELTRIEWPAPSLRHNVSDALGMALKALNRMSGPPFAGEG